MSPYECNIHGKWGWEDANGAIHHFTGTKEELPETDVQFLLRRLDESRSAPRDEITEEEPKAETLSPLLSDLYQSIAERDAEIARLRQVANDALYRLDSRAAGFKVEPQVHAIFNGSILAAELKSHAKKLRDALAAEPQQQTGEAG